MESDSGDRTCDEESTKREQRVRITDTHIQRKGGRQQNGYTTVGPSHCLCLISRSVCQIFMGKIYSDECFLAATAHIYVKKRHRGADATPASHDHNRSDQISGMLLRQVTGKKREAWRETRRRRGRMKDASVWDLLSLFAALRGGRCKDLSLREDRREAADATALRAAWRRGAFTLQTMTDGATRRGTRVHPRRHASQSAR